MKSAINNKEISLHRKAAALARMGLVNRIEGHFRVSNPSGLNHRTLFYTVERGLDGVIRCDCAEFQNAVEADPNFRCEHIRAVKIAIAEKNTEPSTRASSPDGKTTTESGKPEPGEQKLNGVFPFM